MCTSSAAWTIAFPSFASIPDFILTSAQAFLTIPNALMTGSGILSGAPPILKFWIDLRYQPWSIAGEKRASESEHPNIYPTGLLALQRSLSRYETTITARALIVDHLERWLTMNELWWNCLWGCVCQNSEAESLAAYPCKRSRQHFRVLRKKIYGLSKQPLDKKLSIQL